MKFAVFLVSLISSVALATPNWKVKIINPSGVATIYQHKDGASYEFGGINCSVTNFVGDRMSQKKGIYCSLTDAVVSKLSICELSPRVSLRRGSLDINDVDASTPINFANKHGLFAVYLYCE